VKNTKLKAILWMLLASFLLSLLSITISKVDHKVHLFVIFFFSTTIGFISLNLIKLFNNNIKNVTTNLSFYFIRCALSVAAMLMWFITIKKIPINDATAISYLVPLMNAIAAIILLKERLRLTHITVLIFGLTGAYLVLKPSFHLPRAGVILALITTVIWCLSDIITKIQSQNDEPFTQTYYSTLFMAIFSLPAALIEWSLPSMQEMMLILVISMIQLANLYCFFKAYHSADLLIVAPIDFTRLLFTACLTYFFFGETLSRTTIIGSLLIMLATIYMARKESK
jgi:drug/metabolite transporter (DMT)-like permease